LSNCYHNTITELPLLKKKFAIKNIIVLSYKISGCQAQSRLAQAGNCKIATLSTANTTAPRTTKNYEL